MAARFTETPGRGRGGGIGTDLLVPGRPGPQQPPAPAATPWLLTALRHVLQARHKGGEVGIVSVLLLGRGLQVREALSGRASKGGTLRGSRGDCKWLPVAGRPLAGPILPQNPLNPTNPMHSSNSPTQTGQAHSAPFAEHKKSQSSFVPPSPPAAPPAPPARQGDFEPPPGSGAWCSCGPRASGEAQIMRGTSCPFHGALPPPYPMPKPTSMGRRCPSRLCSEPARPGPPQWKCSCSAR